MAKKLMTAAEELAQNQAALNKELAAARAAASEGKQLKLANRLTDTNTQAFNNINTTARRNSSYSSNSPMANLQRASGTGAYGGNSAAQALRTGAAKLNAIQQPFAGQQVTTGRKLLAGFGAVGTGAAGGVLAGTAAVSQAAQNKANSMASDSIYRQAAADEEKWKGIYMSMTESGDSSITISGKEYSRQEVMKKWQDSKKTREGREQTLDLTANAVGRLGYDLSEKAEGLQGYATQDMGIVGKTLAGAGISIGQQLPLIGMTLATDGALAPLALAGMSSIAGGQKAYDVTKAGGSAQEAALRGGESAAIEAATEIFGLENLGKGIKAARAASAAKKAAQAADRVNAVQKAVQTSERLAKLGNEHSVADVVKYGVTGNKMSPSVINRVAEAGTNIGSTASKLDGYSLAKAMSSADLTKPTTAGKVLRTIQNSGGIDFVKGLLKQSGIEASEEGASYALNYVADIANDDPDAKFSWQELLSNMAGGAVAGAVFGGIGGGYAAGIRRGSLKSGGKLAEEARADAVMQNTGGSESGATDSRLRDTLGSAGSAAAQQNGYTGEQLDEFTRVYNASARGEEFTSDILDADALKAAQEAAKQDSGRFTVHSNPGLAETVSNKVLSRNQRRLMDKFGKMTGLQIVMAPEVDGGRANAQIDNENAVLTIAADSENPFLTAMTHEVVHRIRSVSPAAYQELSSYVAAKLSDKTLNFAEGRYKDLYDTDSNFDVSEEIVSDAVSYVLGNEKALNEFVTDNRSTAQRILDSVLDFISKLRNTLSGKKALQLGEDQKLLFRELDDMQALADRLQSALRETEASVQTTAAETAAEAERGREEFTEWVEDGNEKNKKYNSQVHKDYGKPEYYDDEQTAEQEHQEYALTENQSDQTSDAEAERLPGAENAEYSALIDDTDSALEPKNEILIKAMNDTGSVAVRDIMWDEAAMDELERLSGRKLTGNTTKETRKNIADAVTALRDIKPVSSELNDSGMLSQDGEVIAYKDDDHSAKFSLKTYDESGKKELHKYLSARVQNNEMDAEQAQEIEDELNKIYDICSDLIDTGQYAAFSAWSDAEVMTGKDGKPLYSVVKKNSEYKMNLDFSLVCKKRRALDRVFSELVKSGVVNDFNFSQEDIVRINDAIRDAGFETACALCFVDSKRFNIGKVADTFVEMYNDLVNSLGGEADYFNFGRDSSIEAKEGITKLEKPNFRKLNKIMKNNGPKSVPYRIAKLLKENPEARRLLSRGDFLSSEGFKNCKAEMPEVMKLYNSKKGTGGPKGTETDVQYMSEILKRQIFDRAEAYAVGGVRIQSFSDYVPRMVFDYCQIVGDLAAKQLPAHAYTKEVLFAKQFGLTGIKVNMSLVPKVVRDGAAPGLDKYGNYAWQEGQSFGSDTSASDNGKAGFDMAVAIQKAAGYSNNCGTIAVGVSDEHILKMLRDNDIRMVIPYHKSALNPIVAQMNHIEDFTNYESVQHTRKRNGKNVAAANEFGWNEAMQRLGDAKAAANEYLAWCKKRGYTPKFDAFSGEEGYYKLLIDFNSYNEAGEVTMQGDVKAVFPDENSAFGSMKELIESGLDEDQMAQDKLDEAIVNGLVDNIRGVLEDSNGRKSSSAENKTVKHSLKTTDKQLDLEINGDKLGVVDGNFNGWLTQRELDRYNSAINFDDIKKSDFNVLHDEIEKAASRWGAYSENGKPVVFYHGTRSPGFTKFGGDVKFFSKSADYAGLYTGKDMTAANIYRVYLKVDNIKTIDFARRQWNDYNGNGITTDELAEQAKNEGYDAVRFLNVGSFTSTAEEFAVFDNRNIKSAESITTYDNKEPNGLNIIDPVLRFNPLIDDYGNNGDDIRYNKKMPSMYDEAEWDNNNTVGKNFVKDTANSAASFEKSVVRDDDGELIEVYHGTSSKNFNIFDFSKTGNGLFGGGFYFTENKSVADSYKTKEEGSEHGVFSAYLNIENPLHMEWEADSDKWIDAAKKTEVSSGLNGLYDSVVNLFNGSTHSTNEDAFNAFNSVLDNSSLSSESKRDTLLNLFEEMGYDGLTHIGGGRYLKGGLSHRVWIAFYPNQIKSSDAFTYDDNRNLIPLSQRFDNTTDDLRYSKKGGRELAGKIVDDIVANKVYRRGAADADSKPRTVSDDAVNSVWNRVLRLTGQKPNKGDAYADSLIESSEQFKNDAGSHVYHGRIKKDGALKRFKAEADQIYRDWWDSGEEVRRIGNELNDDEHLYSLYDRARASTAMAENMIGLRQVDVRGNEVGESLKDIWEPINEKGEAYKKDFQMFLWHRHNIDRMGTNEDSALLDRLYEDRNALLRDWPTFAGKTPKELADIAIDGESNEANTAKTLRELNRQIEEISRKVKPVFGYDVSADYSRAAVNSYLRNHPEFDELAEKVYEYSRNLMQFRVDCGLLRSSVRDAILERYPCYVPTFRVLDGDNAANMDGVQIGKTVKKAKGGNQEMYDIDVMMARQTMNTVREGMKNRFGEQLLLYGDARIKNIRKDVDLITEDNWDEDAGGLLTHGKNDFTVCAGGQRITMTLTPELMQAIDALTPESDAVLLPIRAARATNAVYKKLITEWNPAFVAKNFTKDMQDALLYSKDTQKWIKNYPEAVKAIKNNEDIWKQYLGLGGQNSSVYDYNYAWKEKHTGLRGKADDLAAKVSYVNAIVEQAPRLAEFMTSLQNGNSLDRAMFDAASITTNFGRSGRKGKQLNANFVPFLNPSLQGFDQFVRFVNQPTFKQFTAMAAKCALLGIVPSIINSLMYGGDDDWEYIPEFIRDTNYMIKVPGTDSQWIKIPKGRALSLFGMAVNTGNDLVRGNKVEPLEIFSTAFNQIGPANPIKDNILAPVWRSGILNDEHKGKTWYGADLENDNMQSYRPGERYDEKTDIFSKWLGSKIDKSPKKINNLIDSYTGVAGDILLPALTPTQVTGKNFFTKSFTHDTLITNDLATDFYETSDKLKWEGQDRNWNSYVSSLYWDSVSYECADIYSEIHKLENDKTLARGDRRERIRELKAELNDKMRDALETLPKFQKAADKYMKGNSEEELHNTYLHAMRDVYSSERAMRLVGRDYEVEDAELAVSKGASWDSYFNFYMNTNGYKYSDDKGTVYQQKLDYLANSNMSDDSKGGIFYSLGGENYTQKMRNRELYDNAINAGASMAQLYSFSSKTRGLKATEDVSLKEQKMDVLMASGMTTTAKANIYYAIVDSYGESNARELGLSNEKYFHYMAATYNIHGVKGADGKTVSGSYKKQMLPAINALPLTPAEKDAIFLSKWSGSTLYQAPWH